MKDFFKAEQSFFMKTGASYHNKKQAIPQYINPNRQVYFLASFYQDHKKECRKFAVIDAETKQVLFEGNGYKNVEFMNQKPSA